MTDITDQDRRLAREWATIMEDHGAVPPTARAAARVILATVDAPPRTLAEELENITDHLQSWTATIITRALNAATTRAKQTERDLADTREALAVEGRRVEKIAQERDEARAEVDRLTDERLGRNPETKARVEAALNNLDQVEKVTVQKGAESNAETLDPADVKPGEAWLVEVDGEKRNAIKDGDDSVPWNTINGRSWISSMRNADVKLLHRLAPAPRVITDPKDLNALAVTSIIRDGRGWPGGITDQGMMMVNGFFVSNEDILSYGPVTVLWEPEA